MDAKDTEILVALQRDGHRTQQELAQLVGLSQPAVAERIRKLEERGVITGYVARVDPPKLGQGVTAFVWVGISHPKYFDAFARRIAELPGIQEAHRVAGRASYLLKVRTRNTTSLDELLIDGLRRIPGVVRTETTVVLASIKEDTFVPVAEPEEGS